MPEYIEREAILSQVISAGLINAYGDFYGAGDVVLVDDIKDIPAADAEPVRHGRLIATGYDELYCEFGNCSICGADMPIWSKYCLGCGAKLDAEG